MWDWKSKTVLVGVGSVGLTKKGTQQQISNKPTKPLLHHLSRESKKSFNKHMQYSVRIFVYLRFYFLLLIAVFCWIKWKQQHITSFPVLGQCLWPAYYFKTNEGKIEVFKIIINLARLKIWGSRKRICKMQYLNIAVIIVIIEAPRIIKEKTNGTDKKITGNFFLFHILHVCSFEPISQWNTLNKFLWEEFFYLRYNSWKKTQHHS